MGSGCFWDGLWGKPAVYYLDVRYFGLAMNVRLVDVFSCSRVIQLREIMKQGASGAGQETRATAGLERFQKNAGQATDAHEKPRGLKPKSFVSLWRRDGSPALTRFLDPTSSFFAACGDRRYPTLYASTRRCRVA
jgi:hypothetical protein